MNIYTLEVFIVSGPVSDEFVKENPGLGQRLDMQSRKVENDKR